MAADKQDTKDEIVAVGPGAEDDAHPEVSSRDSPAGDDYRYPEGDDTDSPGRHDASEERAGHAEDDGAPDDGSSLSREQRRRRRKREKYDRDQRELALLRTRNEQLERQHSQRLAAMETRQTQSDVLVVDGRISQLQGQIAEAEALYTQARRANDPDAEIEALRVRDQLKEGLRQAQGVKHQTVRADQERQSAAQQPPVVDPAISVRAREWARDNPWFDPRGQDEDSAIAYAVERRVFAEGRFDATSDEYWDEVDRRLAKRLPERYSADETDEDEERTAPRRRESSRQDGARKPSGPAFKVGGRDRPLRKGEVYIDEDRKAAMIMAGVWDDPKERQRYLESYQRYDRDAGRRTR